MNKAAPIWLKVILTLIFLAAGWFLFFLQNNKNKRPEKRISKHLHEAPIDETIKGNVIGYGSNPDGDIDQLLISANQKKLCLHFPPHVARYVTKIAPIHAMIIAKISVREPAGHPHLNNQKNNFEIKYLLNQATKMDIDLTAIPPLAPNEGTEMEIEGSYAGELKSRKGNTFILSGKLIALPPHIAQELMPLIKKANLIVVKGKMRDSTAGFVSASGKPVMRATQIRLDSITYKIR